MGLLYFSLATVNSSSRLRGRRGGGEGRKRGEGHIFLTLTVYPQPDMGSTPSCYHDYSPA